MSINVKYFDEKKAEAELKKCPKIVRDYVKKLKENRDNWRELAREAISKLQSNETYWQAFAKFLYKKEYLVSVSVDEAVKEFEEFKKRKQ